MKKRSFAARIGRVLWKPLLILAIAALFLTSLTRLDEGQREEGRAQLEEALRRAAVSCYADQGIYPPSLDYLLAHSGVQVDFDRYAVFYDVFAENLMPDITVVELPS